VCAVMYGVGCDVWGVLRCMVYAVMYGVCCHVWCMV
jgi:hypothetical protein